VLLELKLRSCLAKQLYSISRSYKNTINAAVNKNNIAVVYRLNLITLTEVAIYKA
jgi:hypothetical protein